MTTPASPSPAPVSANLSALNTHAVGASGLIVGLLGILGFISQAQVSAILVSLLPASATHDASAVLMLIGLALAYYGRPHTIDAGK